jgi:hypothetical protein
MNCVCILSPIDGSSDGCSLVSSSKKSQDQTHVYLLHVYVVFSQERVQFQLKLLTSSVISVYNLFMETSLYLFESVIAQLFCSLVDSLGSLEIEQHLASVSSSIVSVSGSVLEHSLM